MSSAASGRSALTGHRIPTAAKRIPCAAPPTTVRGGRSRSTSQTARSRSTTPYLTLTTTKVLCHWSLPCRLCLTTPCRSCQSRLPSGFFNAGSFAATATTTQPTVLSQRATSTRFSTRLRRRSTSPRGYRAARPSVPDAHESRGAHVGRVEDEGQSQFVYSIHVCVRIYIHTLTLYVSDRKGEKTSESEGVT